MKRAALLILLLTVSNVEAASRRTPRVNPRCGYKTASYRFVGNPRTVLVYGNKAFTIPSTGAIELVAERSQETYRIGERTFRVPEAAAADEFGTVTVDLSQAHSSLLLEPGV